MLSKTKNTCENTSTPKRRRLGMGKSLQASLRVNSKRNNILGSPDVRPASPFEKYDDPPLPCNQIEFLCDSGNTSSASSEIPCSPGVLDCTIMKDVDKWESLVVSKDLTNIFNEASKSAVKENEIEDISEEMFFSKLEHESSGVNHVDSSLLTSRCERHFREHIEESFSAINQSIAEFNKENNEFNNDENGGSTFFESKDSFLLDIKESQMKETNQNQISAKDNGERDSGYHDKDSFYGLPMMAKSLFKTYRNIEKFYDWQEECLNLPAIRERRNLIYSLPTSGGKTLVAEVLMLREVLFRKKNALFILPFVAIVQEKIWSLSPFALQLEFLVEEYAAGKGHLPPKKRRKKHSIYIATIEKGLALVRSLVEENRLDELGLIVVDELHLIGEPGRGASLETLLTTVLYVNKGIQVVGMSATIGNLPALSRFLRAEVFHSDFRPVRLAEYVKLDDMLYTLSYEPHGVELVPHRQLNFDYSAAGASADPDLLGGLVSEVVPEGSCLVFCPTKRNCENVAMLLCKLQRKEMLSHCAQARAALAAALRSEGAAGALESCVRCGVAYHHAGLSADERALLEHAFRSGVVPVLCCTSTLAAGVNLPARRVIVRAPRQGRQPLPLAAYRQMAGRAGRAGVCDEGDSIVICSRSEWPALRSMLGGGLGAAHSVLRPHVSELLLSAVALNLAADRLALRDFLACTLLATDQDESSPVNTHELCDDALRSLLTSGALEERERLTAGDARLVYNDTQFTVSCLGRAAIKGCMELSVAARLLDELSAASRALVLAGSGSLHLLYLVTHTAPPIKLDYAHYYSLYCNLDEEGIQTAKILGITEVNAIRMVTGKPITNVSEAVLCRFYIALMLHDLWKQVPMPVVADKYLVGRGAVQSLMTSCAAFAGSALRLCEQLERCWPFRALLAELQPRLLHCAAPELHQLMELPAVRKARALQLWRAGFKRVEDVARAQPEQLAAAVPHLARHTAAHLISAARLLLIEKVENLRAEAEDVMEGLNI